MNIDEKYTIEVKKIDNGTKYPNKILVKIFLNTEDGSKTEIGEYTRNYGTMFNTFYPFELKGKEYALYSKDYTATRVMTLPDCIDWCGEDPYEGGFCPTDYYIPSVVVEDNYPDPNDPEPIVANHNAKKWATIINNRYYWPDDLNNPNYSIIKHSEYLREKELTHKLNSEWRERHPFVIKNLEFGFVAGCHWGDDSSWKIQRLDLRKLDKKIIKREDVFGYIRVPDGIDLKEAISEDLYEIDNPIIQIALPISFNIETGQRLKEN